MQNKKLRILHKEVRIQQINREDYVCLSDIARYKDEKRVNYVVQNWLRTKFTIEFIGLWEKLSNPNFKDIEFDAFRNKSGSNSFILTPKMWINKTNAIGIISKLGRYGGTYAHKDIAFEFASWISPEFKLYLIKEFQRLKEIEIKSKNLDWNLKRNLAKVNYKIHTETIKKFLIPKKIYPEKVIYSTEADILNLALFGITAREWRNKSPKSSLRDNATPNQLICLTNLESLNSVFIKQGLNQKERLIRLNDEAIYQMKILEGENINKKLLLKKRMKKYGNP